MIYILEQGRSFIKCCNDYIGIQGDNPLHVIAHDGFNNDNDDNWTLLGIYETPERAMKVVQDIWDELKYWERNPNIIYFEMPKE